MLVEQVGHKAQFRRPAFRWRRRRVEPSVERASQFRDCFFRKPSDRGPEGRQAGSGANASSLFMDGRFVGALQRQSSLTSLHPAAERRRNREHTRDRPLDWEFFPPVPVRLSCERLAQLDPSPAHPPQFFGLCVVGRGLALNGRNGTLTGSRPTAVSAAFQELKCLRITSAVRITRTWPAARASSLIRCRSGRASRSTPASRSSSSLVSWGRQ